MITAAFIVLFFAASLGGLWLLMQTGPGWPSSEMDPSASQIRTVGTFAAALFVIALALFAFAL